jgi:hypothetical protein
MNKIKWKLIADKVKQKGGGNYSVSYTSLYPSAPRTLLMNDSPTISSASTRR